MSRQSQLVLADALLRVPLGWVLRSWDAEGRVRYVLRDDADFEGQAPELIGIVATGVKRGRGGCLSIVRDNRTAPWRVTPTSFATDEERDTAARTVETLNAGGLWMIVIYDHPKDYPEHFVVRECWARPRAPLLFSPACRTFADADQARAHVAATYPDAVLVQPAGVDPDPVVFEAYA